MLCVQNCWYLDGCLVIMLLSRLRVLIVSIGVLKIAGSVRGPLEFSSVLFGPRCWHPPARPAPHRPCRDYVLDVCTSTTTTTTTTTTATTTTTTTTTTTMTTTTRLRQQQYHQNLIPLAAHDEHVESYIAWEARTGTEGLVKQHNRGVSQTTKNEQELPN